MCADCDKLRPIMEEFYQRLLREFPVDDGWMQAHGLEGAPKPPANNRAVSALIGYGMQKLLEDPQMGHPRTVLGYILGAMVNMVGHRHPTVHEDALGVAIALMVSMNIAPKDVAKTFFEVFKQVTGMPIIEIEIKEIDVDNASVPLPPMSGTKH